MTKFLALGIAFVASPLVVSAADLELQSQLITTNTQLQPSLEQQRPLDAVVLWNGRNLTGWRMIFTNADVNIAKTWSANGGILTLHGKGTRPGYLETEDPYSNYLLHVEWRWSSSSASNANSGVLLHLGETNAIWPVCVEAQLKTGSAGELVGMGGVDFPAAFINNRKRAKIKESSEQPMGDWNSYDIYCRSNTIEVHVNGVRKNLIEQVTVSGGHIGLQLEGHDVEFRNIWLKPE